MTMSASNFTLVEEFHLPSSSPNPNVHVSAYTHTISNIHCVLASTPGPLATAVILVPTAVSNHAGLPHTLEHLCFMGSSLFPDRGFLDSAALLCLSSGTNAWTDCDMTCYTISTAGPDGLYSILPIFLDHVLNPTLDESAFQTEIYHIDGHGNEQGVVFCEMMARESSLDDRLDLAVRRALYGPNSTYSWECGGLTDHIRHLKHEDMVNYHADQYRPSNISVLLFGHDIDPSKVLPLLNQFPCLQTPPCTQHDSVELAPRFDLPPGISTSYIVFPTDEEFGHQVASIAIAFQGPDLIKPECSLHHELLLSLEILCVYLGDGSASPLHQAFVEGTNAPGTEVDIEFRPYSRTMIQITVSGIEFRQYGHLLRPDHDSECDTDQSDQSEGEDFLSDYEDEESVNSSDHSSLADTNDNCQYHSPSNPCWFYKDIFVDRLLETLRSLVSPGQDHESHLTKQRIEDTLLRFRSQYSAELEENPHELLITAWAPMLACTSLRQLGQGPDTLELISRLLLKPIEYWRSLIQQWMIDAPIVQVKSQPSIAEAEALELKKQERLQYIQKNHLLGEHVTASVIDVDAFRNQLPGPADFKSVSWFPYHDMVISSSEAMFPTVHHVSIPMSNFVHAKLFFELPKNLSAADASYLVLIQELLFQLPLLDGTPWTLAVEQLQKATVSYSCSVGLGSHVFGASYLSETLVITFTCLPNRLADTARLIALNVNQPDWSDVSRVATVARSLIADITDHKQDGNSILSSVKSTIIDVQSKNRVNPYLSVFAQDQFLRTIVSIKNQSASKKKETVNILKRIHQQIFNQPWFVQLAYGQEENGHQLLATIEHQWMQFKDKPTPSIHASFPFPRLSYTHKAGPVLVVPMGTISASYISVWTACNLVPSHQDYLALNLVLEIIQQSEGPLYTAIRGPGLAYDVSLYLCPWSGTLNLVIGEAMDPIACMEAALQVIQAALVYPHSDKLMVDKAKSILCYNHAAAQSSLVAVAGKALSARLFSNATLTEANVEFTKGVDDVSISDLQRVASLYLVPLLDPQMRCAVMLVPKASTAHVVQQVPGNVCLVPFPKIAETVL